MEHRCILDFKKYTVQTRELHRESSQKGLVIRSGKALRGGV